MKKRTLTSGLMAAALAAGLALASQEPSQADTLPEGLYVGEYSLGGMTEEEAGEKVQSIMSELENQKITLIVDDESVDATAKELGFYWINADAVSQAAAAVTDGNLIQQYLNRKDMEHNHVIIPLETSFDDAKVEAFVKENCASAATEPVNASITRENGAFAVTPSATGKSVDVAATKAALDEAVSKGLKEPVAVTALVAEVQPAITEEALSTIQDVLGTFSTNFSSSGQSRATNLQVGAGKINGRVLMPGEALSGYECLQPFTTDNGYATAAAYENGKVVDSVGGGVCQISTTLYNAALRAELEITQRQNHSMIVTYVKPSEDAAIAGTYKDLKFTNNYDTPIYVEGYTSGRTLTFAIYGKETRPANRTFEFVSETLGKMDPGPPKEEVDPAMAPGTRKQVQSAHIGYKSRLWKYVYVDGAEQSKEILHTDTYNATKAVVKVGPAAPAAAVPIQEEPSAAVPTQPEGSTQGMDGGADAAPEAESTDVGSAPGTEPADAGSTPETKATDAGSVPETKTPDAGSTPETKATDADPAPETKAADAESAP